ncbi:MAG: hypothetical protein EWV75_05970 [Microcystis wesenbergii Mw_QC_S_20081001_S30D]|uniref:Uncharacterized protein n=2 Tax=Microcystis wesenbergii TaxID=44823 RepID=A0A552LJE2_9CHRO|nr:MAG: hypothetical protein EWV75_05970 [Microcystis wesenbergii Mw_QC_S_20081001_S30D]TRV01104.1 MAG: hypothetical protein EWV74_11255 [Microcystis wesenbergii Mw_QC_S_20081001_S30]TRV04520.1 MAG: hypothetical protein EWV73_02800 [Microcystis wesenbergii Mw_QC_B_20070930_S4D]TRV10138.1 MAG: hypothetical protein EWV41_07650 [Microcystis wesenbergii Mw_MB_S_20031200_S109]TRV11116.1 MAG: hypothetical protein EWV89_15840 [Microcystis wesenbergii Mw_QC_B_20070930_S4]TRV20347.1 MAG: hypothetical p
MFVNLLSWRFFKGNSRLKLGVISDFITQSKALVGSTPQTPECLRLTVRCLHAIVHIFVPI